MSNSDRWLEIFEARVALAERGTAYARQVLARHVRGLGRMWRDGE